jgi:hypothetical protein
MLPNLAICFWPSVGGQAPPLKSDPKNESWTTFPSSGRVVAALTGCEGLTIKVADADLEGSATLVAVIRTTVDLLILGER